MSQQAVEIILAKIVTDDEFRAKFFRAPEKTCLDLRVELTLTEMDALQHLPQGIIARLAMNLDPRIVRAALGQHEAVAKRQASDNQQVDGSQPAREGSIKVSFADASTSPELNEHHEVTHVTEERLLSRT
jgi:hypothetical protein